MGVVSMKQLLEAGVHFGHQTRRWNPKMARYIFTERNGIYIIDLQKTVKKLDEAYMFVRDLAANGGNVLFVGTKKQAGDSVREEATRAGAYYVNARWLGGMMTNFKTIRRRIDRLAQLRKMEEDGTFDCLPHCQQAQPRDREARKVPWRYQEYEEAAGSNVYCRPQKREDCGCRSEKAWYSDRCDRRYQL